MGRKARTGSIPVSGTTLQWVSVMVHGHLPLETATFLIQNHRG